MTQENLSKQMEPPLTEPLMKRSVVGKSLPAAHQNRPTKAVNLWRTPLTNLRMKVHERVFARTLRTRAMPLRACPAFLYLLAVSHLLKRGCLAPRLISPLYVAVLSIYS
jgi:hypothetical protein